MLPSAELPAGVTLLGLYGLCCGRLCCCCVAIMARLWSPLPLQTFKRCIYCCSTSMNGRQQCAIEQATATAVQRSAEQHTCSSHLCETVNKEGRRQSWTEWRFMPSRSGQMLRFVYMPWLAAPQPQETPAELRPLLLEAFQVRAYSCVSTFFICLLKISLCIARFPVAKPVAAALHRNLDDTSIPLAGLPVLALSMEQEALRDLETRYRNAYITNTPSWPRYADSNS